MAHRQRNNNIFGVEDEPRAAPQMKQKVLSLGVNQSIGGSNAASDYDVQQREQRIAKQDHYRNALRDQMDVDSSSRSRFRAEEDQHPLDHQVQGRVMLRKKHDDEEEYDGDSTGFMVGSQMKNEDVERAKRANAQRHYREQLEADINYGNSLRSRQDEVVASHRKPYQRRSTSPVEGYMQIGADEDEVRARKKAEAREFYAKNADDIARRDYTRQREAPPDTQNTMTIGMGEEQRRAKEAAKRREYLSQLNADVESHPASGRRQHYHQQNEMHREYANRSGLGGLDVSGRLSNNATSEREMHEKRMKQQQYRHELEEQQYADEQRRLYEIEAPVDPAASVPYMRH